MADDLLVVPAARTAVPVCHSAQHRADAGPRAGEARGEPSAGVLDSQTVKSPYATGGGGFDAGKLIKGRKRHIQVDTDGRLLMVQLTAADVQEASGAEQIVKAVRKRLPWLKHLFADGAYDCGKLMSAVTFPGFVIEVVRRLAGQQGFQVLPRRWVVERTFGWMAAGAVWSVTTNAAATSPKP
jgi:transposase